jgi:hypothetical protein
VPNLALLWTKISTAAEHRSRTDRAGKRAAGTDRFRLTPMAKYATAPRFPLDVNFRTRRCPQRSPCGRSSLRIPALPCHAGHGWRPLCTAPDLRRATTMLTASPVGRALLTSRSHFLLFIKIRVAWLRLEMRAVRFAFLKASDDISRGSNLFGMVFFRSATRFASSFDLRTGNDPGSARGLQAGRHLSGLHREERSDRCVGEGVIFRG